MRYQFYLFVLCFVLLACESKTETLEELLKGSWQVEKSELNQFALPGNCYEISKNAIFKFSDENKLSILRTDKELCSNYKYSLIDSVITIQTTDIEFKIGIKKITKDKLQLSSSFLSQEMMANWKEEYVNYKQNGFNILLSKK